MGQRKEVEPILQVFGLHVRARRLNLGWSQQQLSEKAGIHLTYLSSLERGHRNVSLLNLVALARALEVHPHELLEGTSDLSPRRHL